MSQFAQLEEQMNFLLQKQKESFLECSRSVAELLEMVQQKLTQTHDEDLRATLTSIHESLQGQMSEMVGGMQKDIEFLNDQVKAIKQTALISDAGRRLEVQRLLLEEAGELMDTAAFKKQVDEEAQAAKQELMAMITDIQAALQEGNEEDLELMLEAMTSADEDDESEEEDDGCCGRRGCEEDEQEHAEQHQRQFSPSWAEEDDEEACCASGDASRFFGGASCCGKESSESTTCCGGEFSCGEACVCDDKCGCDDKKETRH